MHQQLDSPHLARCLLQALLSLCVLQLDSTNAAHVVEVARILLRAARCVWLLSLGAKLLSLVQGIQSQIGNQER
jgi:hypothetical protein